MLTTQVKRVFLLILAFILVSPVTSFAEMPKTKTPKAEPSSDTDLAAANIKDLTVRETLRYGLELYRKGNTAEAVNVFQSILKQNCTDRLAQYHLQKIARLGPEFTYVKDYLKTLPCEQYNFNEEDFLPASFYFEKDTDLMLEQLEAYNKRYLNSKAMLTAKIREYNAMAEQLDRRTREMTDALETNKKMSAEAIAQLKTDLSLASNDAKTMDAQIAELKKSLAQTAISEQQKEIEKHKDAAIAGLKENFAGVKSGAALPTADEELASLQAKFADIHKRLTQINNSIAEKNKQLSDLQENLEAVKQ